MRGPAAPRLGDPAIRRRAGRRPAPARASTIIGGQGRWLIHQRRHGPALDGDDGAQRGRIAQLHFGAGRIRRHRGPLGGRWSTTGTRHPGRRRRRSPPAAHRARPANQYMRGRCEEFVHNAPGPPAPSSQFQCARCAFVEDRAAAWLQHGGPRWRGIIGVPSGTLRIREPKPARSPARSSLAPGKPRAQRPRDFRDLQAPVDAHRTFATRTDGPKRISSGPRMSYSMARGCRGPTPRGGEAWRSASRAVRAEQPQGTRA